MGVDSSSTDEEIRRAVVDRTREVSVPGGDPVSEGLLEDVDVEDGVVTFTVVFSRLDQRMGERVTDQLRGAGLATEGVEHVRIEATSDGSSEDGLAISGVETVIAVGSAKGGVGKSTITAALARALSEAGLSVGVFDANVYAPDVPDLLEAEGPIRSTQSGRPKPITVDGIELVSLELIADDGPVAWRGAMVHDVVTDLLGNAVWTDRDVLLVDLPPGIGDAVYTVVQQSPVDGSLLVTTPTDAGARATERTGALFTANDIETIGVVANMVEDGAGESPFNATDRDFDGLVETEPYASVNPIPFDPTLREPTTCSFADPETSGERAIAALGEVIEEYVTAESGPAAPEDIVDLRGLPPETGQQQALSELGIDRQSTVSLLVRHDPSELVSVVEETLERDARELERSSIDDLGTEGWLVELEPEPMTESVA